LLNANQETPAYADPFFLALLFIADLSTFSISLESGIENDINFAGSTGGGLGTACTIARSPPIILDIFGLLKVFEAPLFLDPKACDHIDVYFILQI
jgi:hypothetical protein